MPKISQTSDDSILTRLTQSPRLGAHAIILGPTTTSSSSSLHCQSDRARVRPGCYTSSIKKYIRGKSLDGSKICGCCRKHWNTTSSMLYYTAHCQIQNNTFFNFFRISQTMLNKAFHQNFDGLHNLDGIV